MSTATVNTVRNLGPVSDSPVHVGETEAQALHRLAAQAKARGIKLIVNQVTNHHFCTSASNRDKLHAVTLYSCDCRGFITHGRCMHLALVLEAYHSLPSIDSEPDPDGGGEALPVELHLNCGVIEDGAYLRRGAALGVLGERQRAALAELDRQAGMEPDDDVVLSIVPARSPLDQANRAAIVAYLDSARDRAARWELTSSLLGEDSFTAGGLTDRALECWARTRLGLPTLEIVCASPLCCGRGYFQSHPEDDRVRCDICNGRGIVPGHAVNVAVFTAEVAIAA